MMVERILDFKEVQLSNPIIWRYMVDFGLFLKEIAALKSMKRGYSIKVRDLFFHFECCSTPA
jgi:hypothetical protein